MANANPLNVKIEIETIELIIEEYNIMKNQFIGVTDNDVVIHCYKYLNGLKEYRNE